MESSLFGFGSNLPHLEGRKFSPLLTADIDDDGHEYNALNDETFGAEAVEEDWESDHEKFSAEIQGRSHEYRDNGAFLSHTYDKKYQADHSSDDIVQSSIKHLVLDDELDDPAIMSHSEMISKKSVAETIKSIFNRSPPPPALIDSDLTGSPIMEGIWSSPQRRDSSQVTSNLIDLSSLSMKTNERHVTFCHNDVKSAVIPAARNKPTSFGPIQLPPVKILPNAKTVEELERDMLKDVSAPSSGGAMTLQDVEREIFLKPRAKTVSEIENELGGQMPPPTPGGIDVPSLPGQHFPSQLPIGTPHSNRHMFNQTQHARPVLNESNNSPLPPGVLPQRTGSSLPGHGFDVLAGPRHHMPQLANSIHPNTRMMGPPVRNFNGYPVIPHPILNKVRHPAAGRLPQHASPPRYSHNNNMADGPGFPLQYNHNYNQQHRNMPGSGGYNTESLEVVDPYAGLMTQKEKDWLIKIQMLQLQSDNPYLDDYYFMLYKMKKMAREKMREQEKSTHTNAGPKLVLPERGKLEVRQYTPTQYQGSLGKIQVMSVNNPRKMIDIVEKNNDDDEEAKRLANKELRRYRRGLVDIEKLYDLILELDDLEKKMLALPQEAQINHQEERSNLILRLFDSLGTKDANDKFIFIMSVRKGRRLVVRLYPLLNESQQMSVLEVILRNLATILKRDQVDQILVQLFPDIEKLLDSRNFSELVQLQRNIEVPPADGNFKPKNVLSVAIQSKVGSAILLSLLSHAEQLFKSEQLKPDADSGWSAFVLSLHKLFTTTPDSAIATPLSSFPDLWSHFQRFVMGTSEQTQLHKKLSTCMILSSDVDP